MPSQRLTLWIEEKIQTNRHGKSSHRIEKRQFTSYVSKGNCQLYFFALCFFYSFQLAALWDDPQISEFSWECRIWAECLDYLRNPCRREKKCLVTLDKSVFFLSFSHRFFFWSLFNVSHTYISWFRKHCWCHVENGSVFNGVVVVVYLDCVTLSFDNKNGYE